MIGAAYKSFTVIFYVVVIGCLVAPFVANLIGVRGLPFLVAVPGVLCVWIIGAAKCGNCRASMTGPGNFKKGLFGIQYLPLSNWDICPTCGQAPLATSDHALLADRPQQERAALDDNGNHAKATGRGRIRSDSVVQIVSTLLELTCMIFIGDGVFVLAAAAADKLFELGWGLDAQMIRMAPAIAALGVAGLLMTRYIMRHILQSLISR